jgi:penicillin V acylase-like amidase (Ntn superfamily)
MHGERDMARRTYRLLLPGLLLAGLAGLTALPAGACTRVTYLGPADTVVTGRSMDWMESIDTNLWALPAGIRRSGAVKDNAFTWTSRYGSVVATAYDAITTDGMNEKGLVANLLYLAVAQYGARDPARPGLTIAAWAQYFLDSFATVDEAVAAMKTEPFQIVAPPLVRGNAPSLHLSLSDATGDSAILEYLDGKLVIHHGRQFQVMTNDPTYDQQLALDAYWRDIGGAAMLPGTDRPADRFVRASYYLGQAPRTSDPRESVAAMFGIMRNVSVPMGVARPGQPNVAATLWRSVSDQTHRIYYFDETASPNVFWVSLDKLNLGQGGPVEKLDLAHGAILAGDTADRFQPATAFTFLSPEP